MTEENFIDFVKNSASEIFNSRGVILPMLLMVQYEGGEPILGSVMLDMSDKNNVSQTIRSIRLMHGMVCMISEFFILRDNLEFCKNGKVSPSENPNRIESVGLIFYFGMKVQIYFADIIRSGENKPFLASWVLMDMLDVKGNFLDPPASWN